MRFNFSGINTESEEATVIGFNNNVKNGISQFVAKYDLEYSVTEKSAADMISSFIAFCSNGLNQKMYILVDEYDHFANELLSFRYEFFKESVSRNGFVRKFYEAIKEGTGIGIVDRLFITGVSSITLDSMTSGFNIAKNITSYYTLNEILGFTKEEVLEIAKKTISDKMQINKKKFTCVSKKYLADNT